MMKHRFTRTELEGNIWVGVKKKAEVVRCMMQLQESTEDGIIEFEGNNGTYTFEKNGDTVMLKKGNGIVVRKRLS